LISIRNEKRVLIHSGTDLGPKHQGPTQNSAWTSTTKYCIETLRRCCSLRWRPVQALYDSDTFDSQRCKYWPV